MVVRSGYLERFVAGAIFGLYMAHLLYYLNPQIEITPWKLAFVTMLYGVICGLLFGTALWLLRKARLKVFGEPDDQPRGLGVIVSATFLSAAVYGGHFILFRVFLPLGVVRLLAKATVMITITGLLFLILWVITRNTSPRMSRTAYWGVLLLIAFSSVFLYQRREHYTIDRREAVVVDVGDVAGRRPVILVAVRGLPYDWLVTMMGESRLPFFEESRAAGYFTRTEPFPSTHPRALTASLVTGKLPYRHGVTGRFAWVTPINDEENPFLLIPYGVGFRQWGLLPPVRRNLSTLPTGSSIAFWTAIERAGLRSATFNWPAAVLSGTAASIAMPDTSFLESGPGREQNATVVPESISSAASKLTARRRTPLLRSVRADLSAAASLAGVARERSHSVATVSLNMLADAPRLLGVDGNDLPSASTPAGGTIRAYVEEVDRILGDLARTRPDAVIMVVSPAAPNAPAIPDSPIRALGTILAPPDPGTADGFFLIRGRHVVHAANATPARVVDIVPTLLFASGLPLARDMDGRAIVEAFDDAFLRENLLSFIQTYEAERLLVRRSGV